MSLSQATSPEEVKRELKQQVFLAIQGKYDTRQTSQLIEDINKITDDIMGGEKGIPPSYGAKQTIEGWQGMLNGLMDSDILEIAKTMDVDQSRHIKELISDGALKVVSRQSGSEELDKAVEISKAIMDQPYNDAKVDAKPVIAGESKPFLLVDDQMKSYLQDVVVDKNGMPERNVVKMEMTYEGLGVSACQPVNYYRHSITVISGGWSFKRWFYCDEQNISSWSETRLLGMLDYVNKFFADNMEDSMNT